MFSTNALALVLTPLLTDAFGIQDSIEFCEGPAVRIAEMAMDHRAAGVSQGDAVERILAAPPRTKNETEMIKVQLLTPVYTYLIYEWSQSTEAYTWPEFRNTITTAIRRSCFKAAFATD